MLLAHTWELVIWYKVSKFNSLYSYINEKREVCLGVVVLSVLLVVLVLGVVAKGNKLRRKH